MIYFLIGTKAQFIKMAPVILETQQRGLQWTLIDMGQHAGITARICQDFGIKKPARALIEGQETVSDYSGAARWLLRLGKRLVLSSRTRDRLFPEPGIILVHGDTLSTLMGTLLGKRLGIPVGLVEAGLTSGRLLSPFPEELTRRVCERLCNMLFAPGEAAARRLERCRGTVINSWGNTGEDALRHFLKTLPGQGNYLLVTLHRLETLRSRRRLSRVVGYLRDFTGLYPEIRFVLHPPTRRALEETGLISELQALESITFLDLLPYPEFLDQVAAAKLVLTDGGSVQEECSYLHKPCIILRNQTERPHGLGKTAILTSWKVEQDLQHITSLVDRVEDDAARSTMKASSIIVDAIESYS